MVFFHDFDTVPTVVFFSMIFELFRQYGILFFHDFETVPTVWYLFVHFSFYHCNKIYFFLFSCRQWEITTVPYISLS